MDTLFKWECIFLHFTWLHLHIREFCLVSLFCAIVRSPGQTKPGAVVEVEVDVDDAKSVDTMKDAIAEKQKYSFPATDLKLYLAKRNAKNEVE
jgi:hypothetical protein